MTARPLWRRRRGRSQPTARPAEHGGSAVDFAIRAAVAAVPRGSLTVRMAHRLPPVAAGQDQLERVLAAMVETASRRTPPGARMLVRADAIPGGPGRPGAVEVRVADRGPALPGEAKSWLLAGPSAPLAGPSAPLDGLPAAVRLLTAAGAARLTAEDNPAGGLILVLTLPAAART